MAEESGIMLSSEHGCYLVLALGGAQSLYFILRRPWSKQVSTPTSFDPTYITTSPVVSSFTLGVWRLLCSLYIAIIGVAQFLRVGTFVLRYYTCWNWWLLALYFLVSGSLTLIRSKTSNKVKPSKAMSTASYAATALFHVNVTTVALVDSVTWLVLVPMVKKNPDKEHVKFMLNMLYNFTSYNQHGFNAVLIVIDLFLNNIQFCTYMVGYAGVWSLVFSLWAQVWHRISGRWLYPFMDTSQPWAPVAYFSLYIVHFVYYATAYLLIVVKQRLLRVQPSSKLRTE